VCVCVCVHEDFAFALEEKGVCVCIVCVCVRVCMYIYIYIYTHVYVNICMHVDLARCSRDQRSAFMLYILFFAVYICMGFQHYVRINPIKRHKNAQYHDASGLRQK